MSNSKIIVAMVIALVAIHSLGRAATLTGKVQTNTGAPIAGAVIDIYTAKPRSGASVTCPSCYRDCAKETKAGADGSFKLDNLDSSLLFRVLVMAPGYRSTLTELIDPDKSPLDVQLEPIPSDLPTNRTLTGRVLDDRGQPLAGAIVFPRGGKTAEKRWWGDTPGVDEASITDEHGRFMITSREPMLGLDINVRAAGFAELPMQSLDLNGREHEVRMQRGASVSAALSFKGRALAGRTIGIVQIDRSPMTFVGETVLQTDSAGAIQFHDLQPNQSYVLYSLCEPPQMRIGAAVLRTQRVETGGPGEVAQVKDLQLRPGLTISGQVEFPAGAKEPTERPKDVKLRLSRDPAWDWYETTIDEEGRFKIDGLPAEVYTITITARGFELDNNRLRFQSLGPTTFAMRLRSDKSDSTQIIIPLRSTTK